MIGDGFKSLIQSDGSSERVDFTIDFGKPVPIMSIFIENPVYNFGSFEYQKLMGESHLRHGSDHHEFSMQNAKIVDNITSGGFFQVSADEIQTG